MNENSGDESVKKDVTVTASMTQYPTIKRMISSLDKFLNRRIAGIVLLYVCAIVICGSIIIVNGVTATASDGSSGWSNTTSAWLYSILAILTLFVVLVAARVVVVKRRNKQ